MVGEGVEAEVPGALRVSGTNRHGTAGAVLAQLWDPVVADGFRSVVAVQLGRDDGWTAALAAAPLAAGRLSPQVGLWEDSVPVETSDALGALSPRPMSALVVGDEGWVQEPVVDALADLLAP